MTAYAIDLSGKVAIVTGSGRGLGKVMAAGFAAAGASVVTCSRTTSESEETAHEIVAAGGKAIAMGFDATDPAQCRGLVDKASNHFGGLDVMLANAGISTPMPAEEMDTSVFDEIIKVNITGAFNCAQAAARRMTEQGRGGSIVFTSSNASQAGFRNRAAYCASKAGVDGMARAMALEWGGRGIRVNSLNPGWMEHSMSGVRILPERRRQLIDGTPLGRPGRPEELIGPAVFLASDASSFVTGVALLADGGWCAV